MLRKKKNDHKTNEKKILEKDYAERLSQETKRNTIINTNKNISDIDDILEKIQKLEKM